MKKLFALPLALVLAVSLLAGCASSSTPASTASGAASAAGDTELNLYTWEGMFPQEVLDAFTAETGIKIVYSSFDTDETMLTRLQAANGGDYDLVIADDYIIQSVVEQNLAQKLDKSKIANWGNINPVYQGQFYDAADEYTVPYGAGVQTIVYDPAAVDKEITGYADLWDEAFKDNLAVIGNLRVINGMALKVLGKSYNTEDLADIDAAGAKLLELAPNIRAIIDDNTQDLLLTGEVAAAVMYTSQVTQALIANPDLKVVYPTEGIGFGIMANFIPVNAPHPDAAHQFINYILQPEVSAQCFEYLGYYCTNAAAEEFISDEYKSFLTLPADFGETEMIQPIGTEALAEHEKVWTEFKTAAGA